MDAMRALSFPFDDDNWIQKFVVGALMMLLGIFLPFIHLGYQVIVTRNVIQGKKQPLPGTDTLDRVFVDGLIVFVGGLVYGFPVFLIACVLNAMGGVLGDSSFLFICLSLCCTGFAFLYALLAIALYWMGMIRYAETGYFSEFLQFRALWNDVRYNMGTLLLLLAYALIFSFLMCFLIPLSIIICVGPIVLLFYSNIVIGYLIGQAGLEIINSP